MYGRPGSDVAVSSCVVAVARGRSGGRGEREHSWVASWPYTGGSQLRGRRRDLRLKLVSDWLVVLNVHAAQQFHEVANWNIKEIFLQHYKFLCEESLAWHVFFSLS